MAKAAVYSKIKINRMSKCLCYTPNTKLCILADKHGKNAWTMSNAKQSILILYENDSQ